MLQIKGGKRHSKQKLRVRKSLGCCNRNWKLGKQGSQWLRWNSPPFPSNHLSNPNQPNASAQHTIHTESLMNYYFIRISSPTTVLLLNLWPVSTNIPLSSTRHMGWLLRQGCRGKFKLSWQVENCLSLWSCNWCVQLILSCQRVDYSIFRFSRLLLLLTACPGQCQDWQIN